MDLRFVAATAFLASCWPVVSATCYGVGDIVGSVIGTLVATLLLVALALYARRYMQRKKAKKRPLTSDRPDSEFGAFVNPNFQDDEHHPAAPTLNDAERGEIPVDSNKGNSTLENKNQANAAKLKKGKPPKSTLLGNLKNGKSHKQRALDDSCINLGPEKITVPLRGIDFTGLGFNVCGNMRDGIFIKDVLHRGPAMESGKIKAGDRILNLTVSFTSMVYEDALTILSYASPYDVQLEIQKMPETSHIPGHQKKGSNASNMSGFGAGDRHSLYHPLYRSQSIGDLSKIGREDLANKRSLSVGGPTKVVKRDGFIKTSHSLREEGTGDLNSSISNSGSATQSLNEKVHVQMSGSVDSLDGDTRPSRFKVQKVSEADENQMTKTPEGTDGAGTESKRRSSSSSSEGGPHYSHPRVHDSPVMQPISFSPDELYSPFGKVENTFQTKSTEVVQATNVPYVTRDQDARSMSSESSKSFSEDDPVLVKMEVVNLDSGSPKAAPVPVRRTSVPGKRKAPAPPPVGSSEPWLDTGEPNVTVVTTDAQHVTTLKVSPDIHDVPSWVAVAGNNVGTKGIQTNFSSSEGENSESESEVERDGETGAIAKKPTKSKKEENRRASSLGDLTRVKEAGQKGFPLERSVSMDFNHAEVHPVDGQLGVQREQIKTKLAMVDENVGENGLAPLKKHFGASENLHLDNSYLESWENLEKGHSKEKIDGVPSEDEDEALMELDAAVRTKANGNSKNSLSSESSEDEGKETVPPLPQSPVPRLEQVPNDGMSDISLSDREMDMSDASSSLSDDSLGGKKHRNRKKQQPEKPEKPVIKKMIPLDHTLNLSQLPSSSESDSDDDGTGSAKASNDITRHTIDDQEEVRAPPHILHDSSTGSSLVTIGAPQITQAWEKAPGVVKAPPASIDPEMAKIFNNITVSNMPKNPITLDIDNWTIISDDKNGLSGRDEGNEAHNGNGTASPNVDRQYEATLEMDVSGQSDVDNKFGLISFESTPPGPQKPSDNKYSNFTVSEGGVSRAMIISNPQLAAPVAPLPYDSRELESPPKLQPLE